MIRSKKIFIATHFLLYGAAHALRDFLVEQKADDVTLLSLPFHTQKFVIRERHIHGKKLYSDNYRRSTRNEILCYILDFYTILRYSLAQKGKYDLFVGVNNLNCLAGLLLKKLNKVNRVVYYSIDFVPIRFPNKLLNHIYHAIEIFAVRNADEVWNVSPRIAEGRKQFLKIAIDEKQKVLPIGVWNDKVKKVPFKDINMHHAIFIGHILEKQGVQEVIKSIPSVIRRIKDFRLIVIGDGDYSPNLKLLARQLDVEKYVIFRGWVKERSVVDQILSENAIAIATYKPEEERLHNFTYYADPTKIKDYLSAGLPIILTDVSYNAHDLEKRRCAVVVEYNAEEIAKAIILLLENKKKLVEYRTNALNTSKEFDWENIFSKVRI